jgi:endonuclease YncB( thermonuclease family)
MPSSKCSRSRARTKSHALARSAWTARRYTPTPGGNDCGKVDRYRREVCVMPIDGKDANLVQVAAGMAWWYRADERRDLLPDWAHALV